MERIGIWALSSVGNNESAKALSELTDTETEQRLEDLLVASPEVLVPGLTLIGRQIQTAGGPLDLLGVDNEGRIVLFELKRGTLTRDAVAQILDYASDLQERAPEDFASLIERASGHNGIDAIEDFNDWYQGQYQFSSEPPLDELRLVLVGLGADDRARRIVNLLASAGVDIQLLTFQAFASDSGTLLARRVETVPPRTRLTGAVPGTKAGNQQLLEGIAREQGVSDLLSEVSNFIDKRMPCYRWPRKTGVSFNLREITEEGKPTQRTYVALYVDRSATGRLTLALPAISLEKIPNEVDDFITTVPAARRTSNSWTPFELPISSSTWPELRGRIEPLLATIVTAWEVDLATREAALEDPTL